MKLIKAFLISALVLIPTFSPAQELAINAKDSWCKQIVLHELNRIENFFTTNQDLPDDKKIELLLEQSMRLPFFRMQIIARIMGGSGGKFLQKKVKRFKATEDLIGQVALSAELRKISNKFADPRLIKHFEDQQIENRAKLISNLMAEGFWTNASATVSNLKNEFTNNVNWKDGKSERSFIIHQLSSYAIELHKLVKNNTFDNADIEEGLHEMRRRIRWIAIEIATLNGLIKFKHENKLNAQTSQWYNEMKIKNPKLLQSKYLSAIEPIVDNPILIPFIKTSILSEVIANIGDLKDISEIQIYILDTLEELQIGNNNKQKILVNLNALLGSSDIDHQKLAREVQKKLTESNVLKDFAKELEELN